MMKLTEDLIARRNNYSSWRYEDTVEAIKDYETDSKKNSRLSLMECKSCYYLKTKAALQAFTDYECRNCGSIKKYHNSNIPTYCEDCCKEHDVCCRCGANI
jgi:hypothetical protein